VDGILEYVKIDYDAELFRRVYDQAVQESPLSYIECGGQSWVLDAGPIYKKLWEPILDIHSKVHDEFCPFATGFNFFLSNNHTVPPHIDLGPGNCFNLLIPLFGVARLDIYEPEAEKLEFRHGQKHWMMEKPGVTSRFVGSVVVDKPALLNTKWLHSVNPEVSPRVVWCSRWINLAEDMEYSKFKARVEDVLGA